MDRKKIKNIIIYTVMGLLTILLLVSVFVGNKTNENRAGDKENKNSEDVREYSPVEDTKDKQNEETGPTPEELEEMGEGENWEELEELDIEEQEIDESELAPSYEEEYGKEDVKVSREVVKQFLEIIHNVDGDDPMKHIEDSKHYMTEKLYNKLQKDFKQGQMTWTYGVKQKYKSAEVYEPATARAKDGIVWAANVKGTIQIHNEDEKEKTDIYLIYLKKIDGEYKVENYYVNVPT